MLKTDEAAAHTCFAGLGDPPANYKDYHSYMK
jgi:hypothetical protein